MDLREFYQPADGGAAKPGKKGISLTPEQWEALQQVGGWEALQQVGGVGGGSLKQVGGVGVEWR